MKTLTPCKTPIQIFALTLSLLCMGITGCSTSQSVTSSQAQPTLQHILFVGDSFTHGRYNPVRMYNNTPTTGGGGSTSASATVVDENYNTTVVARQENTAGETGPWGGIPGIFAELAAEAALPYDVHIEAISATTLTNNYAAAQSVIDQSLWNTVVLQEATFQPIPSALSSNSKSDPATFCSAVGTIAAGVHTASPNAKVFLYATGAPSDTAYTLATSQGSLSDSAYLSALNMLTNAYHDAYLSAATRETGISGVAQSGDAWALTWQQGIANPDPYAGTASGVSLTFNYQANSQPSTKNTPTDAGFHHPSIYGAYLNALVLFQRITGTDVRTFAGTEKAASTLGVAPAIAIQLQNVAWAAVTQQNGTFSAANYDPCK